MASLKSLRTKIDQVDESLLRLLNARGRLVKDIGNLKKKSGQPIFMPGREHDLMARLKRKNIGPLSNDAVSQVFHEVVHACRSLQKDFRIAFFGPEGTFTHQAALKGFGKGAKLIPCRSIPDVFSEVERDHADYGVVPIENSTEGIVNHTLDMFVESSLSICAEIQLPIHHYLLGRHGDYKAGRVTTLLSHYQALAQCTDWISTHTSSSWKYRECASTADAAKEASKTPHAAAIASDLAGELYGLDMLEPRIEDSKNNFTRFYVIGKSEPALTGHDKTSIMFSIKDRVGALADILAPFKRYRLNMTKIESRPTRQKAWEYVFFVDFLGHRSEKRVQNALRLLERSCAFLKVLGSYPRTES